MSLALLRRTTAFIFIHVDNGVVYWISLGERRVPTLVLGRVSGDWRLDAKWESFSKSIVATGNIHSNHSKLLVTSWGHTVEFTSSTDVEGTIIE